MEPVKGLVLPTVSIIVSENGVRTLFGNIKQLTCDSEYDVIENQTGNWVGKISMTGNPLRHRPMFMSAPNVFRLEKGLFAGLHERESDRTKRKMKGWVGAAIFQCLVKLVFLKTFKPLIEMVE
jgi:hypothetical protein